MIFTRATLVLLASFLFANAFGQTKDSLNPPPLKLTGKKLYCQFGVGYLFNSGVGRFENYSIDKNGNSTIEYVPGSWGKGFDLSFALGKKMTPNLAVELELGYIVGGKNTEQNEFYVPNNGMPLTIKQEASYKSNTFRINPKFVFEVPFHKVNAFYARIGYLVGFSKATSEVDEQWIFENGGKGTGSFGYSYSGGLVSGSTLGLGLRFRAEENTSFFMEINGSNLHRTFEERNLETSSANGKNNLSIIDPYYKQTIYVDKASFPAENAIDLGKPRERPTYRSSYSSVGFRIGFITYF